MGKQAKATSSKKEATRSALDDMINDMVRWKYDRRSREKSLVEMLREKYIIKRK